MGIDFKEINAARRKIDKNQKRKFSLYNIQEGINYAHVMFHHALTNILGEPSEPNDTRFLKSAFDFSKKDFLLLSFKSYKGQIPSSVELIDGHNNKLPRRRFNLYRKGRVWSNPQYIYGRNFYTYLDKINEAFDETPINFISYCVHAFIENSEPLQITITQDRRKIGRESYIYFPTEKLLRDLDFAPITNVLDLFKRALPNDNILGQTLSLEETEKFKNDLAIEAIKIKNEHSELADKPIFKEVIDNCVEVLGITESDQLVLPIIYSSIIYCFNYLPFDLHLFYPHTEGVDFDNLLTLMVAIAPNKELVKEDVELFKKIAEKSAKLPTYEHALNRSVLSNIESLLRWRYIYEQSIDKYITFMNAVENICRSLCRQHDIKATFSSRVKTFESFYNKLLERANASDKLKIEGKTSKRPYKEAINHPDDLKDLVFSNIRDIAGVRVICVFDDDVWKLASLFQAKIVRENLDLPESIDKDDLECSDPKEYERNNRTPDDPKYNKRVHNYRGFHVTVKPGKHRRLLVEYKNIDDVQCEIQIRTNFAHGWSDVQHPMLYKDKLYLEVIDQDFQKEIRDELGKISEALKKFDEEIASLKRRRDDFKSPIAE
jgi:ppGpp synthetase/RelA/SpoT-type nucleotidyltranferase